MHIINSRTKIVATIGPACSSKEVLLEMIKYGVNVCRLNFSHGSHDEHLEAIRTINEIRTENDLNIAIMADLQGPKLRIGEVENNAVMLVDGALLNIVSEKCIGTKDTVYLSYESFAKDVKVGDNLLVDDGKIKLKVIETNGIDKVITKVIHGGILSSKKGVNLPDTKISVPSLTEKDIIDAEFALKHNVDWIALSFVRYATDIIELKNLIKQNKKHTSIIAKIEKPEALKELDNIIDLSDAIMVARGDLGVEVDYDKVPVIQKQIVEACNKASKPVIIATQMMESMITNFRPTRAEANDVANAVMDGADAIMLSGETSVGKYPVEVIKAMHKISGYTEDNRFQFYKDHHPTDFSITFLPDSICYNACNMAQKAKAKAIIVFTNSGYTAFQVISHRPKAKVFVFSANKNILNKLALLWGTKSFYFPLTENIDVAIDYSIEFLKEQKYINNDDIIVHVGSTPMKKKSSTNMLKLSYV